VAITPRQRRPIQAATGGTMTKLREQCVMHWQVDTSIDNC
jgi:hypothetical protein